MTTNKFLICFFGIFAFCSIFSNDGFTADSTFRVDSYIPEHFSDFQWLIDAYVTADGDREENISEDVVHQDRIIQTRSDDNQMMRFTSTLDYFHETSKRFIQWSLAGKFPLSNSNPSKSDKIDDDLKPGILTSFSAGTYMYANWYLSLEGQVYWSYSHNLHHVNPDTHHREYGVSSALMAGWGRIYAGTYAATAQYMVNELEDKGLIVRPPKPEEMKYLADIIYKCRTSFIIDERLHKIESLKAIMKYMETSGIIENTGPYGYLIIQDVWDYFPKDPRFFGFRAAAGLGESFFYETEQTTDEHVTADNVPRHSYFHVQNQEQSPYMQVHLEYHKPLSLQWQIDFDVRWKYFLKDYTKRRTDAYYYNADTTYYDTDRRYKENNLIKDVDGVATVTYLMNSRTNIALLAQATHYYKREYEEGYNISHGDISSYSVTNTLETLNIQFNAAIDYRISIPTSLIVAISMYRISTNEHLNYYRRYFETDVRHYSLSARLVHYLM